MQSSTVTHPLIRKLGAYTRLSREEHDLLLAAVTQRVRQLSAGEDLIREGEPPRDVNVFLTGWSYRYKQLGNGRRQILAFLLPGDLCDHNAFALGEMDHSIAAHTAVTVAELSRGALEALTAGRPRLVQALRRETLVNASVQREWSVNLGQRTALERVAHLFCEFAVRLRAIGLETGDGLPFPLTQTDLADALGLSTVHVNRTLQELRNRGLIRLQGRHLVLPDFDTLADVALFSPTYLHLAREGRHLDADE